MYITIDGPIDHSSSASFAHGSSPAAIQRNVLDSPVQPPASPERGRFSRPLAHCPEAVCEARHAARSVLEGWHVDAELSESVLVVVSELVTNAIEHARPPMVMHLHQELPDGRVWVAVTDGGPAADEGPWTRSCTADEHGRGLTLVQALTEAHGTRRSDTGTTHWARLTAA